MNENAATSFIRKFATSVLENSIDQNEAEKSLNEIHAHFQQGSQITGYEDSIENLVAVPAAKGKALGLNHAALCLLDYKRTVKFLKAVVSVIAEKQKKKPGEVINIFYAGCGPYAPFVTLVAPLFRSDELQFTLLEINKNSVESAKRLIDSLELSDYIKEIHVADAVTFKVPNADSFDILFSETLDALLYRECYVPILFNMLPQFNKDVVLIPENVLINLTFVPFSANNSDAEVLDIGSVFDVRESVSSHSGPNPIPEVLPDNKIDLTSLKMETYESMILDTKVHVHGDIWLDRNESSLTLPLNMKINHPFVQSCVIFNYYMEPETQLNCRFE